MNTCPQGGSKHHARIFELVWNAAYIILSLGIGSSLVWLPWMKFWDDNYLLYLYPRFRPLVANPFFKVFVVVLGIINILIGIQEIVRIKSIWKKGSLSR